MALELSLAVCGYDRTRPIFEGCDLGRESRKG
jgi:hypothetical protein